jgi:mono/diheme cytochrome c family protein
MRAGNAIRALAAAAAIAAVSGVTSDALAQTPAGRGPGAGQPAGRPAGGVQVVSRSYDMKAISTQPTLPDDVYRGRAIWMQRCAYCHDGVGQPSYETMGPWLGAETVQKYGEDAVKAFISFGADKMPGFQYALKPTQMNDVVAFMKTIPATTRPTADQLAGRLPGAAPGAGGGNSGD